MLDRVEIDTQGVYDLMKTDWAMSICRDKAVEVQNRYGAESELSEYTGVNRVNVSVLVNIDDTQDNEILKAFR